MILKNYNNVIITFIFNKNVFINNQSFKKYFLIYMFNSKDNYLINEEVFEYIKFKTTENIKYSNILVSVYQKYLHTLIMKILNINLINQL